MRLSVDVVGIRRRTGSRREVATTAAFDDLVAGEFEVLDGRLTVDLVVEAIAEGVVAQGTASGSWRGPCRRCLEPIVAPLVVEVYEIFERDPTDGETWPIEDERIDLAPVLREAALLALPLVPLCGDDCRGPEPVRFPTLVDADPASDAEPTGEVPARDPRWAALDDLEFEE